MKNFKVILLVFFVFGILVPSVPVFAAPAIVTSRAALGGDDFIDWSDLGSSFTVVADPFAISSDSGDIDATVSNPTGQFERRDQVGPGCSGWSGVFNPCDALLWTQDTVGPMVIVFDPPVAAAGAQIQSDTFGAFTARIDVYNSANSLIGSFSLGGTSSGAGDNSAIFLGASDPAGATIARIEYSCNTVSSDFAINQLDLRIGQVSSIPTLNEWGMIIFSLLIAGTALIIMRKKMAA
ncbi:MAG: IPTL-CTERM sorting domain-containing protein [Desulfobacteraceae bacterium]|nr:MAG: IPTL-CTERM sorting domain-containing protein [Desulfobacteraceae bacterium]